MKSSRDCTLASNRMPHAHGLHAARMALGSSCVPKGFSDDAIRLEGADGGEDLPEDAARYSRLSQLERNLASVAHDACPDLDEAALDTCQRPVRDIFRQVGTL